MNSDESLTVNAVNKKNFELNLKNWLFSRIGNDDDRAAFKLIVI